MRTTTPSLAGVDYRTVAQIMAAIPLVPQLGPRATACEGRIKYTSPDNARRGTIAFAWSHGEIVDARSVVYLCQFCEAHHSGRSTPPRQGTP